MKKHDEKDMSQKGKDLLTEINTDKKAVLVSLKAVVNTIDKWGGLLTVDDVIGTTVRLCIRGANHQRGGGGKRTMYKYNGVTYESGRSLCDALKISVDGDSAPRKIERFIKDNPSYSDKITVIKK